MSEYSIAKIADEVSSLKADVQTQGVVQGLHHEQNTKGISELWSEVNKVTSLVSDIRIQVARYSAIAGFATVIITKLIDHYWKQ